MLPDLRRHFPDAVFVSIQTGDGMDQLIERISEFVARGTISVELRVPAARADLLARLHREGTIDDVRYEHDFTHVTATIPTRSLEVFAPFLPTEDLHTEDTEEDFTTENTEITKT